MTVSEVRGGSRIASLNNSTKEKIFMSNSLAFGKKAFTIAVVATTIAWAVGFSALVPLTVSAASAGDLIKGSLSAVYYYGSDGKRYVFPNEKTYKTWYADFSSVKMISDAELAAIAIGGNVTYKTGLVKIQTSPTVYEAQKGGELRAIPDEATAAAMYGAGWAKLVHDIADAFFTNYKVGAAIATGTTAKTTSVAADISSDKGLAAAPVTPAPATGSVTLSLASDTPAAATAPRSAGDVIFTKVLFSGTGSVTSVKVTLSGLSANTDLSAIKLYDGTTQLGNTQTGFDANSQATFILTTPWEVSGTKTLTIAADIAAAAGANTAVLGIKTAADVVLKSGTVGGTFPANGNSISISTAAILGSLTATVSVSIPAAKSVDAGTTIAETLLNVALAAGANEDIDVTRFVAQKAGTHISTDITGLELYNVNTGAVLATVSGWDADSRAVFDLSASPLRIVKGATTTLEVRVPAGKIKEGAGRTVSAQLPSTSPISARGVKYNLGVVTTIAALNTPPAVISVNAGSMTVVKGVTTPATGNIAPGTDNVKLASWDVTVRGEALRATSSVFNLIGTMQARHVTSCVLRDKDGTAVGGPVNHSFTTNDATTLTAAAPTVTFSSTITYPVGTNTYWLNCNISASATGTVTARIFDGVTANSTVLAMTGVSTGNSVAAASINGGTPAATVAGNTQTVQAGALAVTNLSTPPLQTVVVGAQSVHVASVNLSAATSGENARVTALTITDTLGATAAIGDMVNVRLTAEDGTTLLAPSQNPAAAAIAFTLTSPLVIEKGKSVTVKLYADISASATIGATETHTFAVGNTAGAANVTVAGVATGATITPGAAASAGQVVTLAAGGTLSTSADSSTPTSGIVVAGKSGVTLSVYRFTGLNESIQLRRLVITRTSTTGSDADIAKLYLYDGDTLLGNAVLSGGTATFDITDKNFSVDRFGNPKKLTLKGDFNTTLAGATSGDDLRFDLTAAAADATGAPLGLSSGLGRALTAVTTTLGTHSIRKSRMTLSKGVKNTTALIPGTMDFYVNVTADAAADISFQDGPNDDDTVDVGATLALTDGAFVFTATSSGTGAGGAVTAQDHTVVRSKDGTTLGTVNDDLDANTSLPFTFDTALTVSAGTTEELIFRVNLSGYSDTGDTFQISLATDTTAAVAATSSVIWADDTAGSGSPYDAFGMTELPITHAWVKS